VGEKDYTIITFIIFVKPSPNRMQIKGCMLDVDISSYVDLGYE
jgi:hypothetical protein